MEHNSTFCLICSHFCVFFHVFHLLQFFQVKVTTSWNHCIRNYSIVITIIQYQHLKFFCLFIRKRFCFLNSIALHCCCHVLRLFLYSLDDHMKLPIFSLITLLMVAMVGHWLGICFSLSTLQQSRPAGFLPIEVNYYILLP